MLRRNRVYFFGLALALAAGQSFAQMTVTGSVTGSVQDPSGQAIVGAKVTLTSERSGELRSSTTNETGAFQFIAVQPEAYTLKIEQPGFKTTQRRGIVVNANEHMAVGQMQLELGAVSETISVEAQGSAVQTDSSEHSAILTTGQIESIQARGRDITSFLKLIPGVQWTSDSDSVGGSYGSNTPNIGGMTNNANVLAVDGVVSNDMGTPNVFSSVTTMDAIGEVKVILNSYQAEYAGNGGAVVQVITKSGGREFHGSGYGFLRNEAFNANDFISNRNGVSRPRYRYDTIGFSLGGPIYIPGKFNSDRNKLFGFYNLENWGISTPGALTNYTMPTALERGGDFSQTLDVSGKLIAIKDPTTGQPFAGNVIPANRLNPSGQALMATLPLPNFLNRALSGGNYNYQIQEVLKDPKRSQLFRIDYNPGDRDRFYVRGKTWLAQQQGYAVAAGAKPIGFFGQCYCFTESGIGLGWTHQFAPTVVMEMSTGLRHNHEYWAPYGSNNELNKVLRSGIGYKLSQWYPSSNPQGIIPRFSFGGVPNSPDVTFDDRFLTGGTDFTFTFNDNLTIVHGAHTFKAGMDAYRMREYEGERSIFSGTFAFARDTNNPLDTNWAFSNAALGIFDTYTESTARYGANERQGVIEWFVQDSWKLNRRLTLDYGMRFSWYNQMYPNYAGQQSVFALDLYNRSQAPVLYRPAFGPNNVRMAQDPVTGQLLPAVYIGAFVPGSGNPAPGGVLSGDKNYPRGFVDQQPVLYGPRLGFAYDPFGKGKTAIRGGAAILYNIRVSKWSATTNNPPAIFSPITYYGAMDSFLQTAGVLAPGNTNGFNRTEKTPDVYNLSFGIQQDVGFKTILDVSYLGVFGRHLTQTVNLNTLPYGAHFAAQNADPTVAGKPLPDNFLRPLPGYAGITYSDNAFDSSYNALLVSANRRFARGLQMGVSYTWSKYMDYTGIPLYRPLRVWSYGKDSADQTHVFIVNYTYDVPRASSLVQNALVHHALDNWQISGVASFVSGQPSGISYSTTDGADITGGGDGARIIVTGNPNLGFGDRAFARWFDTSVFARPTKGDPGNAAKDVIRGPGVNNWDLAVSKRFPLKSERRFVQFRAEAYNAFNHTQFAGVNTSASFNPAGQQVNALFGQVTSTRPPRVLQMSLRLNF
jgi:hypothetical protein